MNIVQWGTDLLVTANTAKDGTGSNNVFALQRQPQDVYVDRLVFRAVGSNVATVVRVFLNNGEDHDVAANNALFAEKTLAVTTLDEAAAFADNNITMDLWLPKGHRIHCLLGTTVASGYRVTAVCGRYQDLQSQPLS